jgi:hypothetical protein
VFSGKLGCLKDFKVSIPIPAEVKPRFFKARPVPYAKRTRVEAELDKLEAQGGLEKRPVFGMGSSHCSSLEGCQGARWSHKDLWGLHNDSESGSPS